MSGAVIDAAVRAGATGVEGVEFSTSKRDELYRQALGDAFKDAKAKAQRLAQEAGVTLGAPLQIQEAFEDFGFGEPQSGGGSSQGAPAPPIEPGTAGVEATVTVRFAIG